VHRYSFARGNFTDKIGLDLITPITNLVVGVIIIYVDMFPPTDSAKSAFDLFPTTDNVKDIKPPRSLHVECVVLITRV
jgi:hypothetical protein